MVGEIWCHIENAIIDLRSDPIKSTILGQEVEIYCDIEATQVGIHKLTLAKINLLYMKNAGTQWKIVSY